MIFIYVRDLIKEILKKHINQGNISYYSVDKLWSKYKGSFWRMGGEPITLEMIYNGEGDPNNHNIKTIDYWVGKYTSIGVDDNDYLILKDDGSDELIDGYHRLTSAKIVGIEELPVIYQSDEYLSI